MRNVKASLDVVRTINNISNIICLFKIERALECGQRTQTKPIVDNYHIEILKAISHLKHLSVFLK